MMFKKRTKVFGVLICGLILSFLLNSTTVSAKEQTELPPGDILIMYSDGISDDDMDQVMSLVSELTYQSFQVTFAPASECIDHLQEFSHILCYKIERFPKELIEQLQEREAEGNKILAERERRKEESGENDIRILFVGNGFLRSYLQQTGRGNDYIDSEKQVGKMLYSFGGTPQKEALVREDDFLFMTNDLDDTAGSLIIDDLAGYFSARKGALYHIAASDLEDSLVKAAISKEVSLWKWPYNGEPHIYAQYIVLNEVYPFQNPDKLLEIIKYMIKREEPFVISVMPVYNNGDYPAMQHFCEVLRYAQANGGVIMMHSPINQMPEFDEALMNEYITNALRVYMNQGVYPMGLQIPENWMFHEDTISIAGRFRTVMVADEEDSLLERDKTIRTNTVYRDGHQWIAPAIALDASGTSFLSTYSTAVYFDITDDMESIENKVQSCIASEVPLKSLWDIEHSFWTDEDAMTYRNHIILVNGERTKTQFIATDYEEDFQYNRNMLQRFSKDLSEENSKLIVAVVLVSIIFLWFIFAARRRNKQRFFVEKPARVRGRRRTAQKDTAEDDFDVPILPNKDDFDIRELSEEDDYDIDNKGE